MIRFDSKREPFTRHLLGVLETATLLGILHTLGEEGRVADNSSAWHISLPLEISFRAGVRGTARMCDRTKISPL